MQTQTPTVDQAIAGVLAKGPSAASVAVLTHDGMRQWHGGNLGAAPDGQTAPDAAARTLYDIASVSKLFTATVVLALVDRGLLGLDDPLARYLPDFPDQRVTIRQLLSHTSGMSPVTDLWRTHADPDDLRAAVTRLAPIAEPGSRHSYSCVGYVLLGFAAEQVAGAPLDQLVREIITEPLALSDTGYGPVDPARTVVTEAVDYATPDRPSAAHIGVPPGSVHSQTGYWQGVVMDEFNRGLGGVAGNAGIFSTAHDIAQFGWMVARRGEAPAGREPILREATVEEMLRPQIGQARTWSDFKQGLGWRLAMPNITGTDTLRRVGHPGFTGTALVVDLDAERSVAALTNAVHPTREVLPRPEALRPLLESALAADV